MKKSLCYIIVLMLLLAAGCSSQGEPDGTPFYYCVTNPSYKQDSTAIDKEYRDEIPTDSLTAALEVYLAGPESSNLVSPFPEGLKVLSANQEGSILYLTVSMEMTALSGLNLTMACGCLTLTCLALTDAEQVQISSIYGLLDGQRTIIMDENTLLLLDNSQAGE